MATIGPFYVAFSATISNTTPVSLFAILSGNTPANVTLGAALSTTFGARNIPKVIIQSDPTNGAGTYVYTGDSTLTSTNKGSSLGPGASITINPGRGMNGWAEAVYFMAGTANLVVNITVVYG